MIYVLFIFFCIIRKMKMKSILHVLLICQNKKQFNIYIERNQATLNLERKVYDQKLKINKKTGESVSTNTQSQSNKTHYNKPNTP